MVTWPEADVPKQIYLDLAVSDLDAQCMKKQAAAERAPSPGLAARFDREQDNR
jgi:hypothetical protein